MVHLEQQGGFPLPILLAVSSGNGVAKRGSGIMALLELWQNKLGSNAKHEKLSSYRRCRQRGSFYDEGLAIW